MNLRGYSIEKDCLMEMLMGRPILRDCHLVAMMAQNLVGKMDFQTAVLIRMDVN